ncbi:hypothetical protein T03_4373 [Trichinella britovi]|uniref:Uncharacterized protein n=1 Tax=Trichinella britovi TaxID=45882 RepID=A0A0V1CZQ5_TRIBR|nr:hypothetical protein T03_4373 [Trichinella britovi]
MIHHSSEQHKKKVPINFNAVSFGRIAAPPEQIQGTYAEPRFLSLDKYFYSLHRRGRTHVFNYDSTVIKKDQLFSTLRFHLQYLRQLKKNAKNAFYMADKQEMYPLQFHKRFYFQLQMNRNSLGQNGKADLNAWPGAISSKITKNFAGGVAPSIPCGVAWGVACGYFFENF